MSRPSSSTRPTVGRSTPESRLNSDVLPAPFGPMIPTSSPGATSRETSATMIAPPIVSPRSRVARMGVGTRSLPADGLLGRRRLGRRDRAEHLRHEPASVLRELQLEHRLEHGMVGLANLLRALRCQEL